MAVDNNKAVIKADVIEYYSSLNPNATEIQLQSILGPAHNTLPYTDDRCLPDTFELSTVGIASVILSNRRFTYYVIAKEEHQYSIPLGETNEGKLVSYSSMLPKITTHSFKTDVNVTLYHMDGKTVVNRDTVIGISVTNNIGTITYADGWQLVSSTTLDTATKYLTIIGETPDDNVALMSHTPTKMYSFTNKSGISYYYPNALNNLTLVSGSSTTAPTKTVDTVTKKIIFTKLNNITINGNEDTTSYAYKLNSTLVDGYINLADMQPATGSGIHIISQVRVEATIKPNVAMTVVIADMFSNNYTFNIAAGSYYSQTITNWSGGDAFSLVSCNPTNSGDTLIYGYRKGSFEE